MVGFFTSHSGLCILIIFIFILPQSLNVQNNTDYNFYFSNEKIIYSQQIYIK